MISRLRQHMTFANVGVIVALVLAGSGFAVAAIPGPGGVIKGCFNKRTGALRVLDAKKRCTRSEKAIAWNQQGKPGVSGGAGATGPAGQPGSDAQFNGAAAGGDLTGAYPTPAVKSNALNGTHVGDNSLTGADVDESTLGQVPDAAKLGGVAASSFARRDRVGGSGVCGGSSSVLPPPGGGIGLAVECATSPTTGTRATITNRTGVAVNVLIRDSAGVTTTTFVAALANDGTASTGIDPATDTVREVTFQVVGGAPGVTTITGLMTRRSSGSPLWDAGMQSVT